MQFARETLDAAQCWMRTLPKDIPSEFLVKTALANLLRNNDTNFAKSPIMGFIRNKQEKPTGY